MERPILFSGPMVRAILEGRKTQTRRVFKVRGVDGTQYAITSPAEEVLRFDDGTFHYLSTGALSGPYPCPYGQPGDRLWVRETWGVVSYAFNEDGDRVNWLPDRPAKQIREMPFGKRGYYTGHVIYAADGSFEWTDEDDSEVRSAWKPSIHMPRIASRILLEVIDVRVQRLQDISEADALAEGCHSQIKHSAAFADLWDLINAKRGFGWDANPWVWVLTFKRMTEAAGE